MASSNAVAFADEVGDGTPHLLLGHSAGAYYANAMPGAPGQAAGLALVCPLLTGVATSRSTASSREAESSAMTLPELL